jgi:hypothetical protein
MDLMRKQAARWGAELYTEDVTSIDTSQRPFTVVTEERTVRAHAIVMATGATAKRLRLPREEEFWSRGISACAICDGASPAFRGQEVRRCTSRVHSALFVPTYLQARTLSFDLEQELGIGRVPAKYEAALCRYAALLPFSCSGRRPRGSGALRSTC